MAISASTLATFVNSDFSASELTRLAAVLNSGSTGADVAIGATGGKIGFFGVTTVVQQAKPSGTTDEKVAAIITALTNLGLVSA